MNRSVVNLGNGAVKKTGVKKKMRGGGMVRKKMAGGGMVKKVGVKKMRAGGMVKKVGVKKMAGGGMVKKVGVKKRMRAGGMVKKGNSLKKPSKGQVGLKKLPKAVRNKMGYMADGGPVMGGKNMSKGPDVEEFMQSIFDEYERQKGKKK
ncbi:MAG TPA: hypothetical protein DCE29_13460 [Alteromonas macleodii]|nr:hypothetical protein [Alteromonas macleodii]